MPTAADMRRARRYTGGTMHAELTILEVEDFVQALYQAHKDLGTASSNMVDFSTIPGQIDDIRSMTKLVREIGFLGSYYVKEEAGKKFVVLRGRAGLRNILTSTRYGAAHDLIKRFGLGMKWIAGSAARNGVIAIGINCTLGVMNLLTNDEAQFSKFLADLMIDIPIVLASTAIGTLAAGAALAAAGTIAFPAVIIGGAAFVLGMLASSALNQLVDDTDRQRLADTLSAAGDAIVATGQHIAAVGDDLAAALAEGAENAAEAFEAGLISAGEVVDDSLAYLRRQLERDKRRYPPGARGRYLRRRARSAVHY